MEDLVDELDKIQLAKRIVEAERLAKRKEIEELKAALAAKRGEYTRKDAELIATIGAIYSLECKHREAAESFGRAAALVQSVDPSKGRDYTLRQAEVLAELGAWTGDAEATRESQQLYVRARSDND